MGSISPERNHFCSRCGHPDFSHCLPKRLPSCAPVDEANRDFRVRYEQRQCEKLHKYLTEKLEQLAYQQEEQDLAQKQQTEEIDHDVAGLRKRKRRYEEDDNDQECRELAHSSGLSIQSRREASSANRTSTSGKQQRQRTKRRRMEAGDIKQHLGLQQAFRQPSILQSRKDGRETMSQSATASEPTTSRTEKAAFVFPARRRNGRQNTHPVSPRFGPITSDRATQGVTHESHLISPPATPFDELNHADAFRAQSDEWERNDDDPPEDWYKKVNYRALIGLVD